MNRRHSLAHSVRFVTALAGVSLACITLGDAHAAWPPAGQPLTLTSGPTKGSDLTNPMNWPSDPGYASDWNYWSFLPTQLAGTAPYLMADQTLGASGMSIDKAWEMSIGSPAVTIAIIDSGIEWDDADIVNKAFLNVKELVNPTAFGSPKPENSSGGACAAVMVMGQTFDGYDCDGDGVFTMNDYAQDPRMTAIVTGEMCLSPSTGMPVTDRMAGDVNYNCILDPGDLIQLFSDGVDDDGNGYTDDIAGWDFYKDDNNPYDDVRYGHGTGETKDSTAEGNNNIEDIGVCPLCRFIMLRAGNSFIADSNNFAKGVIYATDNGASVVQEALGAVNLTAFGRAAIDYAYSKNVIVVASMADENSRHHNLPGTYNHTLPVHAIGYTTANSYNDTNTFLNFIDCTNYGGQLVLSVSGTACSSEATGKTAGISGLLYSWGLLQAPPLVFTAEEVMQLQKMTADVVNVPQSRDPATAAGYYESLPGFSQRFGYGRTNVVAAMQKVTQGLIPPEVEIISPAWFATLYANQITGSVPVIGRVVAARATSYDFTVQWAPGVEPLDSDFQTLAPTVSNVPGKTVTGGTSTPLAMLDPSTINTAHTADPDSPQHENDRTITIRVQATAHYPSGTVNGEARRSIAIVNQMNGLDPDLLPGFPLALGGSIEGGAKLADINGDGVRDIVLTTNDGSVHVFSVKGAAPSEIQGFPYRLRPLDGLDPTSPLPSLPNYLTAPAYSNGAISPTITREAVDGTAAIGDVNGDGSPDIVFGSWEGTLYVVNSMGQDEAGWPQRLPQVPSCPQNPTTPPPPGQCMDVLHDITRGSFASPVLVDFNGDGKLEIVLAAFDGNVYVFNSDGTQMSGFPVPVHSSQAYKYDHIITTPAAADFNGDGIPDLAVGTNETVGNQGSTGFFYIVDGRGMNAPGGPYLPNWPILVGSFYSLPIVGQGTNASPVAVDLNGDGVPDTFLQGNAQPPLVLPANPGPQNGSNLPSTVLPIRPADAGAGNGFDPGSDYGDLSNAQPDEMLPLFSHPSVGDLDQDGTPDIVMSGGSLSLALNMAGDTTKPFQQLLGMWSGKTGKMMRGSPVLLEDYSFLSNQAIADITGDNYPEVIAGTGGYFLHAVDACGREAAGWPKFTDGWMTATPAVGDINGDHSLVVVQATREGNLYAWSTKGKDTGVVQWESFHHDNANTGNYATKLDQGVLELAAAPIDCDAVVKPDAGMPSKPDGGSSKPDGGMTMMTSPDGGSPMMFMPPTANPGGGGCGCTVVGTRDRATSGAWVTLGLLAAFGVRKRRSSASGGRR